MPLNSQLSPISIETNQNDKRRHFFFSNRHQHRLLNHNKNNNYYSSKINRTINNCEKFLPDQDLTNSSKENDLLLIHASQSTRFV
jgi:hypothetical protein